MAAEYEVRRRLDLEARVHNLEFALTAYISMTQHLLSQEVQQEVSKLINEFLESSHSFNGPAKHFGFYKRER